MREREVFVLLDEMLEACRNATFFIRGMARKNSSLTYAHNRLSP